RRMSGGGLRRSCPRTPRAQLRLHDASAATGHLIHGDRGRREAVCPLCGPAETEMQERVCPHHVVEDGQEPFRDLCDPGESKLLNHGRTAPTWDNPGFWQGSGVRSVTPDQEGASGGLVSPTPTLSLLDARDVIVEFWEAVPSQHAVHLGAVSAEVGHTVT